MYELKKMERYLRVNLLGPGPRLMEKEFTGTRSHLALMAMATVDYLKECRGLLCNIAWSSVIMSAAGNTKRHPITGHECPEWE